MSERMKHLLITGTGGSGTHYIAEVLRRCGLDIEHESDLSVVPHTASWQHLDECSRYDVVLNQVRDLRKVVTVVWARWEDWVWQHTERLLRWIGAEPLRKPYSDFAMTNAVRHTLCLYKAAERCCDASYRVEDVDATKVTAICRLAGHEATGVDNALAEVSTHKSSKVAYHGRDYLTWETITALPGGRELREIARKWGYG